MFETISFLGQKIELRAVGRRDQTAMEHVALLNFWASAGQTASGRRRLYHASVAASRQLCTPLSAQLISTK